MVDIGSINRSVAILDLFIQGEYELSPTDVTKRTGISSSTAFRTMSALFKANILVASTTRGKYRLSSKMLDLSRAYMSNLNLADVALPYMEELKNKTGESIGLYTRKNSECVCFASVDGNKSIRRVISPGLTSPIYSGSPSKILLAYLPDNRIEEILRPIEMVKITNLTKTTITELQQDIADVRKHDYAITKGENVEHSFAISAPVRDHKGDVIAALSIVGITISLTAQLEVEYIKLVKQAAAKASYDMGYLDRE